MKKPSLKTLNSWASPEAYKRLVIKDQVVHASDLIVLARAYAEKRGLSSEYPRLSKVTFKNCKFPGLVLEARSLVLWNVVFDECQFSTHSLELHGWHEVIFKSCVFSTKLTVQAGTPDRPNAQLHCSRICFKRCNFDFATLKLVNQGASPMFDLVFDKCNNFGALELMAKSIYDVTIEGGRATQWPDRLKVEAESFGSPNIPFASLMWTGMGECGRKISAYRNPFRENTVFTCGCFHGNKLALESLYLDVDRTLEEMNPDEPIAVTSKLKTAAKRIVASRRLAVKALDAMISFHIKNLKSYEAEVENL